MYNVIPVITLTKDTPIRQHIHNVTVVLLHIFLIQLPMSAIKHRLKHIHTTTHTYDQLQSMLVHISCYVAHYCDY